MSNEWHVFMFSNRYSTMRVHGRTSNAAQNAQKRLDLDARLVVERAEVALGTSED